MDENLYALRLCDLPLRNIKSQLAKYKRRLVQELRSRGIHFEFHLYISDEWFCPDGVPGIALPFYLFHPQLMEIEKRECRQVEGRNFHQQLKYLRHELGHCIDNAFRLRRNSLRQKVFGESSQSYPKSYWPKKYSRNFVHYLGENYAQSHPDEDFAETFAVWLDPDIDGFTKYTGTRAYEKLCLMDELMERVAREKQKLNNGYRVDSIEKMKHSLRTHYYRKKLRRGWNHEKRIDQEIGRFFAVDQGRGLSLSVGQYLRRERKNLSKRIAEKTGAYTYQVQWAIDKTITSARIG